jgi:hypothetical protein
VAHSASSVATAAESSLKMMATPRKTTRYSFAPSSETRKLTHLILCPPQAFHQGCYQARFGKKCHRCNKVLKGKVVKALDHLYHPDCFVCFQCSASLSGTRPLRLPNRCAFVLPDTNAFVVLLVVQQRVSLSTRAKQFAPSASMKQLQWMSPACRTLNSSLSESPWIG